MENWQQTVYASPLYIAAIVSLALVLFSRRHRSTPGSGPFALLMLAAGEWALAYALSLISVGQEAKLFWVKVRYFGIVTVPGAWLTFALLQTGQRRWITRRNLLLLTVEPVCILLLIWTNDWHRLYWAEVWQKQLGPFTIIEATPGIFYQIHVLYSYLLILFGSLLFARMVLRSPRLYRGQSLAILAGAIGPLIGDVLSTFRLHPVLSALDMTPFFFSLTGLAMAFGVFHFRLLDIVPVARDAIVESMGDGVIVLDAQNRVVDLNPAAEEILGCSASQAIGQPGRQILSRWPDLVERYRRIAEAHTEIAVGAGAEQHHFDLHISPLRDWRRRLAGRLIVLRDITERKLMEKELQEAKEAAETANQAKSDFVSLVSHELRVPLSAIVTSTGLVASGSIGPVNESQAKFLDIVRSNSELMTALVSDLTDISRIESGRLDLEMGEISLAGIIEEVARSIRPQVERKEQVLKVEVPGELPTVSGDRTRLLQILSNLANNAHKFTPPGGRIAIRAERAENRWDPQGAREVVHVSVEDDGIGIKPEDRDKIFREFFRSEDEEVRKTLGIGLGLNVAKRLVEMQGGRIWFESEFRRGTTFHFTVPLAGNSGETGVEG